MRSAERQVAAPGVDVLAEQRDLAHAVRRERLDLGDERRRASATARGRARDGTMQYEHVELQPIEICTQAWCGRSRSRRQVARELVEGREVAARHLAARLMKSPSRRDVARAERQVDERVALEELVLHRLRPAAADDDRALGVRSLAARACIRWRDEAVVGLLADRAGVEDDDVGVVLLGGLAEPERLEQALDPLGVVDVHLAAERRDVVALHAAAV